MPRATKQSVGLKSVISSLSTGTDLQKCISFCKAMHWHMQFTPNVNSFRANAYKVAAESLSNHGSLAGLGAVPGIGKAMQTHFAEIVDGTVPDALVEIADNGPPFTVLELTRIPGVGPKTALKLHEAYGVNSLADVEKKIQSHDITDPKLIQGFFDMSAVNDRIPRYYLLSETMQIVASLEHITEAALNDEPEESRYRGRVELAGSIRRLRPDVRDIDVLVEIPEAKKAGEHVIKSVLAALKKIAPVNVTNKEGHKKAEIQVTVNGRKRKLDVNFLTTPQWGTAILHFTGPSDYNIRVRKHALSKGYSVSQYAITKLDTDGEATGKSRSFTTEKAALKFLGLPYIAPELRDHVADITVAPKGLLKSRHVFADLHTHTTDSDGMCPMDKFVKYFSSSDSMRYLGISNHSQGTGGGIEEADLVKKVPVWKKQLNVRGNRSVIAPNQHVLIGAEVDIKANGTLGYSDKALMLLDYVVLSIHHQIDHNTTERYLTAIKKVARLGLPAIIGHISGRIIGHRPGAEADYGAVFEAAAMAGVAIEINGQVDRCDCPADLAIKAMTAGCYFVVSSDFHSKNPTHQRELLDNAVAMARRAHIPRKRVINADDNAMQVWLRFRDLT